MTELSFPHDGASYNDAGVYDAEEVRRFFKNAFGFGADDDNRGVLLGFGSDLAVEPTSPATKSVTVGSGAAIVAGTLYYNTADVTLDVDDNTSGYDRVDRVVLELDYTEKKVRLKVVKGPEDGSNAPASLVQSTSFWQVPVARLDVDDGFSSITAAEIETDAYYANLPPVLAPMLLNNSGSEVAPGAVGVLDATADKAFDTTTTAGDPAVVGAAIERIPNSQRGKVALLSSGSIVDVLVTGTVARGDRLGPSATAGYAQVTTDGGRGFAIALEANASGAGKIAALVHTSGFIGASVSRGAFTVPDGGSVIIPWATANIDTHGFWSSGSPTRVTAPFDGYYVYGTWMSSFGGHYDSWFKVLKNGSQLHLMYTNHTPAWPSEMLYLSAGDYIEYQVYQNSTINATCQGAGFWMQFLG